MCVQMLEIFNEIQECSPRAFAEKIPTALALLNTDGALDGVIQRLLICKRATLPERLTCFLSRLFEEASSSNPAAIKDLFGYLLSFSDSKNTKCRAHSLQLIQLLLNAAQIVISQADLQKLSERLFDKEPSVRKEAMRIGLMHQNSLLNGRLDMTGVLKDVVRFDTSHEIRKIGLQGLRISKSTLNCLLERCVDSNTAVRKAFWTSCFPRIDLSLLSKSQRVFLMKSAYTEREFDAKGSFSREIAGYKAAEFAEQFYSEEPCFMEALRAHLMRTGEDCGLATASKEQLCVMNVYYKLKEERDGRDSLKLVDIDEILKMLANHGDDAECTVGLLRLLSYYDLFNDIDRKRVLKVLSNLLTKGNVKEAVEEVVLIARRICATDLVPFLGSIIKKTKGEPICFLLCENIMRHLPYSEMHEAIFQEIAIPSLSNSIGILCGYFYHKPQPSLAELILSFLPNKRALDGATDLVLSGLLEPGAVELCLGTQLAQFDENAVVPAAKLLLAGKIGGNHFFRQLLFIFYSTGTPYIQQYLSLFFHEYFAEDAIPVAAVFCEVLQLITENHKIFIDQALYWLVNGKTTGAMQVLFFNVCLHVINYYDDLPNKKHYFAVLERIDILDSWEPVMTKKIIYLVSEIIRRRPRENTRGIIARLAEVDDGAPLEKEEFDGLKAMIKN